MIIQYKVHLSEPNQSVHVFLCFTLGWMKVVIESLGTSTSFHFIAKVLTSCSFLDACFRCPRAVLIRTVLAHNHTGGLPWPANQSACLMDKGCWLVEWMGPNRSNGFLLKRFPSRSTFRANKIRVDWCTSNTFYLMTWIRELSLIRREIYVDRERR